MILILLILTISVITLNNYIKSQNARIGKNRKTKPKSIKEASWYDAMINRVLFNLRNDLESDKVFVARFHNGGYFHSGIEMKKHTVTHETPASYSYAPMQYTLCGILNSRYPEAILQLATTGSFTMYDIENCPDKNFAQDMKKFGYESVYLFLIEQFEKRTEGFIGVGFSKNTVIKEGGREKVKDKMETLIGLLNMSEEEKNKPYE